MKVFGFEYRSIGSIILFLYLLRKVTRNMSKQKKEKQPPVLGRLLEYAGGQ